MPLDVGQPAPFVFRNLDSFLIRGKVVVLFSRQFHIYDDAGRLRAYVKRKAFKLKEDLRVFRDQTMSEQCLHIQPRQTRDFGAVYDVIDSTTGIKAGALLRSDEWILMDRNDREIGSIKEASVLQRRFLTDLIPQSFEFEVRGRSVGVVRQLFNPFAFKSRADFSADPGGKVLDRRIAFAAVILLSSIEGSKR